MDDAHIADAQETQLANKVIAGAAGVTSVTAGGVTTAFSPKEDREALLFFERRAARKTGKRSRVRTLDLRGA